MRFENFSKVIHIFTKKLSVTEVFSDGFVDMHNHLLPGLDDGAKTTEDSLKMLSLYADLNIQKIIATPHTMQGVWDNTPQSIEKAFNVLKKATSDYGFKNMELGYASEYMMDEGFMYWLSEKKLLTLKDNLILVEMSYFHPPLNLKDILFEIQLQGYKPVLAHPERYIFYQQNLKDLMDLKNAGCLFQLNLLSLTPHYGEATQNTALSLLEKGCYDFLGTDAHKTAHLAKIKSIDKAKITEKLVPLIKNNLQLAVNQ